MLRAEMEAPKPQDTPNSSTGEDEDDLPTTTRASSLKSYSRSFLPPQNVVVMLREPVGFVTDRLAQLQPQVFPPQSNRLGLLLT